MLVELDVVEQRHVFGITIEEAIDARRRDDCRTQARSVEDRRHSRSTSTARCRDGHAGSCLRNRRFPNGFVFSLDPTCSTPLRPELLTRRMRQLRKDHGLTDGSFDATNPRSEQMDNERVVQRGGGADIVGLLGRLLGVDP